MRMTVVNFLDVTLNLHDDTYAPFRKPNDNPQYIHNQSNHPRCVIKQVPAIVLEEGLSDKVICEAKDTRVPSFFFFLLNIKEKVMKTNS